MSTLGYCLNGLVIGYVAGAAFGSFTLLWWFTVLLVTAGNVIIHHGARNE